MSIKKHVDLLGCIGKDLVSGLEGVVTSISFDINGCVQAVITPPAKDGEYKSGTWLDVARIKTWPKDIEMDTPDFDKGYIAEGKKGSADKPAFGN